MPNYLAPVRTRHIQQRSCMMCCCCMQIAQYADLWRCLTARICEIVPIPPVNVVWTTTFVIPLRDNNTECTSYIREMVCSQNPGSFTCGTSNDCCLRVRQTCISRSIIRLYA